MKTKINYLAIILAFFLVWTGCDDDNRSNSSYYPSNGTTTGVNPAVPDAISAVLEVDGAQTQQGTMPEPTGTAESPVLDMVDDAVSYTSGSTVRLPMDLQDLSGTGVAGLYFQVEGATSYFDLPLTANKEATTVLPITIPDDVQQGSFCINVSAYDNYGNISNTFKTCISVSKPMGCNVHRVSGGEGITSTLHDMGENPGMVKIEYETYTVPDRIDVYYDGLWVAGTGSYPGTYGTMPPLANCNNPTDGYIGDNGTFCFNYDPVSLYEKAMKVRKAKGLPIKSYDEEETKYVEVIVFGCQRGGTEWTYDISCADASDVCAPGQEGNPRINLRFDGDVDFDLHVIDTDAYEIYYADPYSTTGGILDVDCICCEYGSENIYWENGTAPNGTYEYWVEFYGACESETSNFTLTVTSNGNEIQQYSGTLSTEGEESQHYTFTLNN